MYNEYGMILGIKFNVDKCLQIGDCGWNAPVNLMLDGIGSWIGKKK